MAEMLRCVCKRDADGLRAILADHPSLIHEDLVSAGKSGGKLRSGRLAHMVINTSWTDALDILWSFGDRFNAPSSERFQKDGRDFSTALDMAAFENHPAALSRMIALGADVNNVCGRSLGEVFLMGAFEQDRHARAMRVLAQAGLDPWKKVSVPPRDTLLLASMKKKRLLLASALLGEMGDIQDPDQKEVLAIYWADSAAHYIHAGTTKGMEKLVGVLAHLDRLGCQPPDLEQMVLAGVPGEAFVGLSQTDAHSALMTHLLDSGLYSVSSDESWAMIGKALGQIDAPSADEWKSRVAEKALSATALEASSSAPRARVRL